LTIYQVSHGAAKIHEILVIYLAVPSAVIGTLRLVVKNTGNISTETLFISMFR
jgi:hypothetical protein